MHLTRWNQPSNCMSSTSVRARGGRSRCCVCSCTTSRPAPWSSHAGGQSQHCVVWCVHYCMCRETLSLHVASVPKLSIVLHCRCGQVNAKRNCKLVYCKCYHFDLSLGVRTPICFHFSATTAVLPVVVTTRTQYAGSMAQDTRQLWLTFKQLCSRPI